MPAPWITVCEAGVPERVKSGGGFTTSVTVTVWTKLPLVPVTVMVNGPVGVVLAVVTVIVEEPDVVTEVGLKLALAPLGNPLAPKVTVPLNPPDGVTLTL